MVNREYLPFDILEEGNQTLWIEEDGKDVSNSNDRPGICLVHFELSLLSVMVLQSVVYQSKTTENLRIDECDS